MSSPPSPSLYTNSSSFSSPTSPSPGIVSSPLSSAAAANNTTPSNTATPSFPPPFPQAAPSGGGTRVTPILTGARPRVPSGVDQQRFDTPPFNREASPYSGRSGSPYSPIPPSPSSGPAPWAKQTPPSPSSASATTSSSGAPPFNSSGQPPPWINRQSSGNNNITQTPPSPSNAQAPPWLNRQVSGPSHPTSSPLASPVSAPQHSPPLLSMLSPTSPLCPPASTSASTSTPTPSSHARHTSTPLSPAAVASLQNNTPTPIKSNNPFPPSLSNAANSLSPSMSPASPSHSHALPPFSPTSSTVSPSYPSSGATSPPPHRPSFTMPMSPANLPRHSSTSNLASSVSPPPARPSAVSPGPYRPPIPSPLVLSRTNSGALPPLVRETSTGLPSSPITTPLSPVSSPHPPHLNTMSPMVSPLNSPHPNPLHNPSSSLFSPRPNGVYTPMTRSHSDSIDSNIVEDSSDFSSVHQRLLQAANNTSPLPLSRSSSVSESLGPTNRFAYSAANDERHTSMSSPRHRMSFAGGIKGGEEESDTDDDASKSSSLFPTLAPRTPVINQFREGAEEEEEDDSQGKKKSINHTGKLFDKSLGRGIFNLSNVMIGSGLMGLPFAIHQSGFGFGLILVTVAAVLANYSLRILVHSSSRIKALDYEQLSYMCFGRIGSLFTLLFMLMLHFSMLIIHIIIINDTLSPVLSYYFGDTTNVGAKFQSTIPFTSFLPSVLFDYPSSTLWLNQTMTLVFISILTLYPLSLFRSPHTPPWISLTSVVSVLSIATLICWKSWIGSPYSRAHSIIAHAPNIFAGLQRLVYSYPFYGKEWIPAFSSILFTFVGHTISFNVYNQLHQATPGKWSVLVHISSILSYLPAMFLSLFGYITFGPRVESNILNNFPIADTLINVGRLLLGVTIVFSYPIHIHMTRFTLLRIVGKRLDTISNTTFLLLTTLIYVISLYLALIWKNLGLIQSGVGAVSGVMLGFILPAIFTLQSRWLAMKRRWLSLWNLPVHTLLVASLLFYFIAVRDLLKKYFDIEILNEYLQFNLDSLTHSRHWQYR